MISTHINEDLTVIRTTHLQVVPLIYDWLTYMYTRTSHIYDAEPYIYEYLTYTRTSHILDYTYTRTSHTRGPLIYKATRIHTPHINEDLSYIRPHAYNNLTYTGTSHIRGPLICKTKYFGGPHVYKDVTYTRTTYTQPSYIDLWGPNLLPFYLFDSLRPSKQFFSRVGTVFLDWTSTKQRIKFLLNDKMQRPWWSSNPQPSDHKSRTLHWATAGHFYEDLIYLSIPNTQESHVYAEIA